MVLPIITPGAEERDDTTSANVERLRTGVLVGVAPEAAETQVVHVIRAATRARKNMINSKHMSSIIHARPTILAKALRALLDTLTQQG